MRTSKAISTISYNSDLFLKNKIEEWKNNGLIEFGMWIRHQPDEDNKKSHCHVFLQPAKLIQTMDFEQDSIELDPCNPDKPFKMISFRVSKESDWLLYAIHDKYYLMEKGIERNYYYSFDDIQSTCDETLNDIISRISDDRKGRLEYRIIDCINRGLKWGDIISSGLVPIRYMSGAKIMYEAITGQSNIDKFQKIINDLKE